MTLYRVNENTRPNFILGSDRIENCIFGPKNVSFVATNDFTLKMTATSGSVVFVNWGDGSLTSWTCNGSEQTVAHDYAAPGSYAVKISGALGAVSTFKIGAATGGNNCSIDLNNVINKFPALQQCEFTQSIPYGSTTNMEALVFPSVFTYLGIDSLNVSGNIANVNFNSGMTSLYIRNCSGITGAIDAMHISPALTSFHIRYCANLSINLSNSNLWTAAANCNYQFPFQTNVTAPAGAIPALGGATIQIWYEGLTSTKVDQFLINLADGCGLNGVLNIAGDNAARTSASDAAKATLLTAGWTLTVNE